MARVIQTPDGEQLVGAERVAEKWPDRARLEDPKRERLARPDTEPERADQDLLIDRADLGPGAATLVVAGDPIPPALADLPRRPRAKAKAGRR